MLLRLRVYWGQLRLRQRLPAATPAGTGSFVLSPTSGSTSGDRVLLSGGAKAKISSIANTHVLNDGGTTTYALASDGSLSAWGDNAYGQLGNGITADRSTTPVEVKLPAGVKATRVIGGYVSAYALASDGSLYAWGSNWNGQLGDGSMSDRSVPVRVGLPSGVKATQMVSNENSAYALASDGSVYAWGGNDDGQLGHGTVSDDPSLAPVRVALPVGVKIAQIAASYDSGYALASDGSVYTWGGNQYGQLGDGSTVSRSTPVKVKLPAGVRAAQMAVGFVSPHVLASDGSVYSWGVNFTGQLGDGSKATTSPLPVLVQFNSVSSLTFGGVGASSPQYNPASRTWSVTAPAHAPGKMDVTINWNLAGEAQSPMTLSGGYTYTKRTLVYRVYNKFSGLHHYTPDIKERDSLVKLGWTYEGVAFEAANKGEAGVKPVYREYNKYDGNHNWTLNKHEHDSLVAAGWTGEGESWWVPSQTTQEVKPVYRLYNPNSGEHVYTLDVNEYNSVGAAGRHQEGVAWYGWKY